MKVQSNIIACLKKSLMQTPSLQLIRPQLFKKVDKNQSIDRSIIFTLELKTAV